MLRHYRKQALWKYSIAAFYLLKNKTKQTNELLRYITSFSTGINREVFHKATDYMTVGLSNSNYKLNGKMKRVLKKCSTNVKYLLVKQKAMRISLK